MTNMVQLTTFQCPRCNKVFITQIRLRQTISGGRPTLIYPYETCNGGTEENPCGFNFIELQVESFDIPIDKRVENLIVGAKK